MMSKTKGKCVNAVSIKKWKGNIPNTVGGNYLFFAMPVVLVSR